MTTLIIGGTGKTGLPLARLVKAAGHPVLLTSRSEKVPEPFKGVQFDWQDAATFENPFKADANIDRVYLITPAVLDVLPIVKPFIDLAISKGVKRFVLMSASQVVPGGPGTMGQVHKYLLDVGVDYTVLRPTWFVENFASYFYHSIREKNEIATATEDGRIPFVSVEDIAQASFDALTAEKSPNKDYLLVGPELYSYEEAAALLSSIIGREIVHKKISVAERIETIKAFLNPDFAAVLVNMELMVANGSEAEYFNASPDKKIVGKLTLKEYFEANKAVWVK